MWPNDSRQHTIYLPVSILSLVHCLKKYMCVWVYDNKIYQKKEKEKNNLLLIESVLNDSEKSGVQMQTLIVSFKQFGDADV